jgi:hypothetical protein
MRNHFAGQIILSAKGSGLKNEMIHKSALALFLLLLGSGMMNCEKQADDFLPDLYGDSHKLIILPDHPESKDQIIAIESICGNESDVILEFRDKQILYKRYFNSLMMMPCSPRADTTIIGQLSKGQYLLIHCLIDKNHLLQDSIFLLDTIPLLVK